MPEASDYFASKMGTLIEDPVPAGTHVVDKVPTEDHTKSLEFTPDEQAPNPEAFAPSQEVDTTPPARPSFGDELVASGEPDPAPVEAADQPVSGEADATPVADDEVSLLRKQVAQSHYLLRKQQKRDRQRDLASQVPVAGPKPDPAEDPDAFKQWELDSQQEAQGFQQVGHQTMQEEIQEVQTTFAQSTSAFTRAHPEYPGLIETARTERIDAYVEMGHNPLAAEQTVNQEVAGLVLQAIETGQDPATALFKGAEDFLTGRGFLWENPEPAPGVDPPVVQRNGNPAQFEQSSRMPHLSQIASRGSGHAPNGGGGVISANDLYARTTPTTRLALEHAHEDFMEALRIHGSALVPEALKGQLLGQ